jgi:thiosulfate/3-mercaptopyruvate sulfurtransferase
MIYTTIVSTDVLAGHTDGPWAIVDCRFDLQHEDLGREQYRTGHIPTAMYADLARDLSGPKTGRNGRHPLPSVEAFAETLGRLGIGPTTQVVAYDQDAGMFAARLWWMLRYVGHDAVAVLDGGLARWTANGHPISIGEASRPATRFVPAPRPDRIAGLDLVAKVSETHASLLVDARAPERFSGQSESLDRAAGHIPGAVNHFFRRNIAPDGVMLPPEALREQFSGLLGDHDPGETVMYCGSGVTACYNLLAMAHAGLPDAKLYPGSWSEWSADPARPVETGS